MNNHTSISAFMLFQFSDLQELQIFHFTMFLALYLTAVTGNLLIIAAVVFDHHLHTSMYFFLTNLAVTDLGSISVIVPKSITNSLTNSSSITYFGCVTQVFSYFFFEASELAILTAMAYDRYIAICNPLQYEQILNKGSCTEIAVIAWIVGLFYASVHTGGTFVVTFCSNVVHQFFCEIPALLKLSCSDDYLIEVGLLGFSCSLGVGCLTYIIMTYMKIFAAVLRIPSVHGQRKALSTCLPHLTVVSVLVLTAFFAYIKPSTTSSDLDIALAVIYTIIPPMLNPFIYSMRNREVKSALRNLLDFGHCSKSVLKIGPPIHDRPHNLPG